MAKSVGVSDEAYQVIKTYADEHGLSLTDAASRVVLEQGSPRGTEVEQTESPQELSVTEIDAGMGYERKPDEVTARDGLGALFSTSRAKNTMGVDNS
jgi:hypothetical protein